jgi:hypothetical protein
VLVVPSHMLINHHTSNRDTLLNRAFLQARICQINLQLLMTELLELFKNKE